MKTKYLPLKKLSGAGILAALLTTLTAFSQEEKPKEEFKPSSGFWGLAFGDWYYKAGYDTLVNHPDQKYGAPWGNAEYAKKPKDDHGISFRRMYLGFNYNFAPKMTANFLLESHDGVVTSDGDRTVFVKAANLEWKNPVPRHTLYIGQAGTPCFSLAESAWGYRSIEKTIGDARGLLPSNDFGLRISSEFKLDSAGGNTVGYHLMAGTGRGSKPEDNRYQKYYGGIEARLMNKKVLAALNLDIEKLPNSESNTYIEKQKTKTSIEGFLGFRHERFTVGVELIQQIQKNYKLFDPREGDSTAAIKDTARKDIVPMGISLFARGAILKDKLHAFARYDMYNWDTRYAKGDDFVKKSLYIDSYDQPKYSENTILFGFDYTPNKNMHLMPNIWINTYTDLRAKPSNYDVTKNADDALGKRYWERSPDIVPRLTFFYVFNNE